jgi:hypothetical protein
MTERTVTEQQVIDAMNKRAPSKDMIIINQIFDELFPELPKVGELILCWNGEQNDNEQHWLPFIKLTDCGYVIAKLYNSGIIYNFEHYRRQTPAERGEGNG